MGVSVTKTAEGYETCNTFKVPGVEEEVAMVSDPPHILKNQRNALFNNKVLTLGDKYVQEAELEHNEVKFEYIKKMVEFQEDNRQLFICPHLSRTDIDIGRFTKMKVKHAKHVLSRETQSALEFCVDKYPQEFPREALTTAWFCGKVGRYYDIMTCRGRAQAFSYDRPEKFREQVDYINWFMLMYADTLLGPHHKGGLLPTQRGTIMSSISMIWIAKYMLAQDGVKFFRAGLVSNDPIENFHSSARANNPKPTCLGFMRVCKAISMCQCLDGSDDGSYDKDGSTNFLTDLKEAKEAKEKARIEATIQENDVAEGKDEAAEDSEFARVINPSIYDDDLNVEEDIAEVNALAYLTGYLLLKTVVHSKCAKCIEEFVADENDEQLCNELIRMRDYRVGALCRPTIFANNLTQIAEKVFRREQDRLKNQKKERLGDKITSKILLQWENDSPEVPKCHLKIIAARFAKLRLHFFGTFTSRRLEKNQKKKLVQESNASRSTVPLYAPNMK